MLKIYIYWHKCYFGHGDNDNRVNLVQVCSLNIEQSRLLQCSTDKGDNKGKITIIDVKYSGSLRKAPLPVPILLKGKSTITDVK